MKYDRNAAIEYARKYALSKNPAYYFFGGIGGDCTNFVSQCLHAGGCEMIYKESGWFYSSPASRSPSWTGVEFFRNFLLSPETNPRGIIVKREDLVPGDIIFLSDGRRFYHSLFISKIENDQIYVCAHSDAALDRNFNTYFHFAHNFVHILD